MVSPNRIAEVAAVIGDPARAMLTVFMGSRAMTAAEAFLAPCPLLAKADAAPLCAISPAHAMTMRA